MKKVYQTIIDPQKGNCMQATMASLFDKELDQVPNFIEYGQDWFKVMWDFIKEQGYEYKGGLYNPSDFLAEKHKQEKGKTLQEFRLDEIKKMKGINGYFFASVYSPKFYNSEEGCPVTHAVVVDKDFNIVHDPNPNNVSVIYPEADKLGYNGILDIFKIEPIDPEKTVLI